jgi:hypothetical protein
MLCQHPSAPVWASTLRSTGWDRHARHRPEAEDDVEHTGRLSTPAGSPSSDAIWASSTVVRDVASAGLATVQVGLDVEHLAGRQVDQGGIKLE